MQRTEVFTKRDVHRFFERTKKPVIIFSRYSEPGNPLHAAVHQVRNVEENNHVALKKLVDKIVEKVLEFREKGTLDLEILGIPKMGVVIVGGVPAGTEVYYFPSEGTVLREFLRMIENDTLLQHALAYYRKYGANPKTFQIKELPRTRIGAAVSYILHSLALATINASNLRDRVARSFHRGRMKAAKRVLQRPPAEVEDAL